MPIKQDSGTLQGVFLKFSDEQPRYFYRGVPPPTPTLYPFYACHADYTLLHFQTSV